MDLELPKSFSANGAVPWQCPLVGSLLSTLQVQGPFLGSKLLCLKACFSSEAHSPFQHTVNHHN